MATVESESGLAVDDYRLTTMRGFAHGVQRFGGVEVDVPHGLHVGGTTVAAGSQRLDGAEALVYAHDRRAAPVGASAAPALRPSC